MVTAATPEEASISGLEDPARAYPARPISSTVNPMNRAKFASDCGARYHSCRKADYEDKT
jgi:hypothetical protein